MSNQETFTMRMAVMWYGVGMLPRLRQLTQKTRMQIADELQTQSCAEPLHMIREARFSIPSWGEQLLTGGQCIALMVFTLWVECCEDRELAGGLYDAWSMAIDGALKIVEEAHPEVERHEFGFPRTKCSCRMCEINCEFVPGMLIPADISRLMKNFAETDAEKFARDHLLASPGAVVVHEGEVKRIPTLVPRRGADNRRCHWLTDDNQCSIHAVAPFGCAFADAHMSRQQAHRRMTPALIQVMRSAETGGLYSRLWQLLESEGRTAPGPELLRQEMQAVLDRERAA